MKNNYTYIQLYLRIATGASYLLAGLDRFGVWGPPGSPHVSWGSWSNFMQYAGKLMFFLPGNVAALLAGIASGAEIVFGVLLIIGLYTRIAAIGSGLLLFTFALCMTVALGIQAPLNYSVFTASAASLLLACLPGYRWSIDALRSRHTSAY
ncbi:MAG TPA: DoxX family protein [Chitinophaga sp.]|uniref:DoxX family protein n=1 Tax=Chitinophaga sp. TaxID=1869181 RepID=UPI002DBE6AAB|nr:DoxX family protein [Chitinophaga sp.]HEU4553847.1 DoxX family protein [Chitinophaga sp.]